MHHIRLRWPNRKQDSADHAIKRVCADEEVEVGTYICMGDEGCCEEVSMRF